MLLEYRVIKETNEVEIWDEKKTAQVLVLPANDSRAVLIRGGGLDALNANALAKLKTAVFQAPELPEIEEMEEVLPENATTKEEDLDEAEAEIQRDQDRDSPMGDDLDPESLELAPEINASAEAPPPTDEETDAGDSDVSQPESTEAVFSGAHSGDPCIYCGVGHDEVEKGECPGPTEAEELEDDISAPPDGGEIHALSSDSDVEETASDDAEISPGEESAESAEKISEDGEGVAEDATEIPDEAEKISEKPEKKPAEAKKPASKTKKKTTKSSKKSEKSEVPAEKEDASETKE